MKNFKHIFLINFGSPNSENENFFFLKRMFCDKAILPLITPFRQILANFIAKKSYRKSWQKYQKIGSSPLPQEMEILRNLVQKNFTEITIHTANAYSEPLLENKLKDVLKLAKFEEIFFVILYPHFSFCTSQSVISTIEKVAKKTIAKEQIISELASSEIFIDNFASEILKQNQISSKTIVIFSAHAIPQKLIEKGDLYQKEIEDSSQKIAKKIGVELFYNAYQSTPKNAKNWQKPSIEEVLERCNALHPNAPIFIIPVSFICENLETLYDFDYDLFPQLFKKGIQISRFKFPLMQHFIGPTILTMIKQKFEE